MLCCQWPVQAGVGAIDPNGSGVLTVSTAFYLWVEAGVLEDVFKALRTHADQEWLMMDATIVGRMPKGRGAAYDAHALGRSKGGLTTKIHGLTDALGLPLRLCSEMTKPPPYWQGLRRIMSWRIRAMMAGARGE